MYTIVANMHHMDKPHTHRVILSSQLLMGISTPNRLHMQVVNNSIPRHTSSITTIKKTVEVIHIRGFL